MREFNSNGGRVPRVGLGIPIDGRSMSFRLPPHRLGKHTEQVSRDWIGYDAQTIARLREQKQN